MKELIRSREEGLIEREVYEFEKIYEKTTLTMTPRYLISRVFDRVMRKYKSMGIALGSIYQLGYIYGMRAERKRRKERLNEKGVV
ncbi:hypothetical protein [Petroclostridium sp. X23]|uniref:hypothetical protein n=1 Tax=Petroclostridium sp. X23 TaxID=3045146 RepID=UPI0024ACCE9A|nr:hypothetical protein [Petroclostridium sp. X23]WHH60401.1 hypothetical protein QKW49_06665 [Petroclostridium sp. X23]